jgi:lipopolysaccharide/colanic/teichoic acid biosynthesis glycosyltransferase
MTVGPALEPSGAAAELEPGGGPHGRGRRLRPWLVLVAIAGLAAFATWELVVGAGRLPGSPRAPRGADLPPTATLALCAVAGLVTLGSLAGRRGVALAGPRRVAKRAIDVAGALAGLVLASPLLVVAAVLVRRHDGGPVLFRQRRVGRQGQTFTMVKLRTMVVDAEARRPAIEHENRRSGPMFKHEADPRVTRPGRFLRAASIDELPQLWNVLRGDMSLVGPRPALPSEAALFGEALNRRHTVRPGITGLWQVEARDSERFEDLERHDLFYVENWSVLLDLALLVRTVGGVVRRTWRFLRGDASLL